jgi:uroporphyrin-III C-methyltransferase
VQLARQHARGRALKGGDPSVFGRLEEELLALQAAGIACEVVPGVTAALAAAAGTQRPLTRRGQGRSVSLSTAMTRDGDLRAGRTRRHRGVLHGRPPAGQAGPTPARRRLAGRHARCVVSRAGWPDELCSDHGLATWPGRALLHAGRPTVVTVGAAAPGRSLHAAATPHDQACQASSVG